MGNLTRGKHQVEILKKRWQREKVISKQKLQPNWTGLVKYIEAKDIGVHLRLGKNSDQKATLNNRNNESA